MLLVHPAGERREALVASLTPYVVYAVDTEAAAIEIFETHYVDLVLANDVFEDGRGLDFLRLCSRLFPKCGHRLLLAAYGDLPEIIRARTDHIIARAIQSSTKAANVSQIVRETLGDAATIARTSTTAVKVNAGGGEMLLLGTSRRLARLGGTVVREYSPTTKELRLQFVIAAAQVDNLRTDLRRRWSKPIKSAGKAAAQGHENHPVLELLGTTSGPEEVYAAPASNDEPDTCVYAIILPWRREPKMTVVLGVDCPEFSTAWADRLVEIHRFAVAQVAEFVVPSTRGSDHPSAPPAAALLEYNLLVTPTYVGPDRRLEPTTLLNRYVISGRRKRVPSRLAKTVDLFVDRIAKPVRRYAIAFVILSAIDTVLTYVNVRSGRVVELNPLLRPLVLEHPWTFLIVKNAVALTAFFLVSRFQLFRIGPYVLGTTVAGYAVLDAYWIWVLAGR